MKFVFDTSYLWYIGIIFYKRDLNATAYYRLKKVKNIYTL